MKKKNKAIRPRDIHSKRKETKTIHTMVAFLMHLLAILVVYMLELYSEHV